MEHKACAYVGNKVLQKKQLIGNRLETAVDFLPQFQQMD